MASDKYAAIDAAILSTISAAPQTFAGLLASSVGDEARKHETRERQEFRVLDARLQALRKAGKIKSVSGRVLARARFASGAAVALPVSVRVPVSGRVWVLVVATVSGHGWVRTLEVAE